MPILTSMPRTNFNYLLVTNFNLFLIIYLITTCSCAAQPFIVAGTAAVYIKKQSINSIAWFLHSNAFFGLLFPKKKQSFVVISEKTFVSSPKVKYFLFIFSCLSTKQAEQVNSKGMAEQERDHAAGRQTNSKGGQEIDHAACRQMDMKGKQEMDHAACRQMYKCIIEGQERQGRRWVMQPASRCIKASLKDRKGRAWDGSCNLPAGGQERQVGDRVWSMLAVV